MFGTSTTTTFVESSAGISEGARTGLASVVTGVLFLAAIVFAPIFTAIPSFATAPALIYVGYLTLRKSKESVGVDVYTYSDVFIKIYFLIRELTEHKFFKKHSIKL